MSDETSRAAEVIPLPARPSPKRDFQNVEFLEASLSDPLNVLRAKLKDLSDLPEGLAVRRVIVISDIVSTDGRGLDVMWSESEEESVHDVQDSVLALVTRVKMALAGSE